MTKDLNVINLGDFKELKEIKQTEKSYETYLKSLANSQLEVEVNYLLDEFSGDQYGKDFFSKGQMILQEIKSRAHQSVKRKIELLTEPLRLL